MTVSCTNSVITYVAQVYQYRYAQSALFAMPLHVRRKMLKAVWAQDHGVCDKIQCTSAPEIFLRPSPRCIQTTPISHFSREPGRGRQDFRGCSEVVKYLEHTL